MSPVGSPAINAFGIYPVLITTVACSRLLDEKCSGLWHGRGKGMGKGGKIDAFVYERWDQRFRCAWLGSEEGRYIRSSSTLMVRIKRTSKI